MHALGSTLVYLDRYRNEGTRAYSKHAAYTEIEERYRPDSPNATFEVATFAIPREHVNIYEANPPAGLRSAYLSDDEPLLAIHPQFLQTNASDEYLDLVRRVGRPDRPIEVAPSSSSRTVYVQDAFEPHALKLHVPFRISRYGRKMRDEVVEQAIAVSRELEQDVQALDGRFAFLREVIGVTLEDRDPGAARGENWGYLVRDMTPFPAASESRRLVPGFALYGRDYFEPGLEPLLWSLIGDADPRDFVLEHIMLPIVRHWAACFRAFGYLLEPHGQNVLLELDGADRIRRIVHRDLSLGIDMRRRRDIGRPDGGLNSYNRMEDGDFASVTYDMFMGNHFFDAIIRLVQSRCSIQRLDIVGPCRDEFARVFPEHADYMPRTVRYFSEKRDSFGKPLMQDTGKQPEWRP